MRSKKQFIALGSFAVFSISLAAGFVIINESSPAFVPKFKIGDQGPAGGVIFYVDESSRFTDFDYLESAPALCEGQGKLWALNSDDLGNALNEVSGWEDDSLGKGKQSTQAMLAASENFYSLDTVSGFTQALNCGGKTDWFVPSKDELDFMYQNLALSGLGEFTDGYYWSSSSYVSGRAWNRPFSEGASFDGNKDGTFAVRPIRSF